ncbi:hypothetical protein QA600_05785 [Natronococcus sp. A-GB1]|uniref:hypothetical protein n=1 Tax=Natronococcus sp. A-GB1 TaxID=3037648 RepID=UPI00241E5039|nr:hypothetical protein [Natronococcus sp. A-GB1]MDG5758848.1 hypothetical protein [Natronococcus sp. A-GB1]
MSLETGDLAVDDESDSSDYLVFLGAIGVPANEYVIWETPPDDNDITIATRNRAYGEDEEVVEAAYLEDVKRSLADWDINEIVEWHDEGELEDHGVRVYGFPESRLSSASAGDEG